MKRLSFSAGVLLAAAMGLNVAAKAELVNTLLVPAATTDLAPAGGGPGGANVNRLGMFSDLYYDRVENAYYGLADRGPGGGLISYETRVEKFTLDVNPNTGAISNFQVKQTIKFVDGNGQPYNGLNPTLLNGSPNTLGRSLDPEGFVRAANGHFFVSDEYGPSVREFNANGQLIRTFTTPANLVPTQSNGTPNYTDGRTTITSGRQDNRGFEGLTISPDGKKLYAVLQDPLVNEGSDGDADLLDGEGRRSRNLRVVEYDIATGASARQFAYQLESLASINARIPGTANDFAATAQGRSIGLSSITAINDHQFLVIERDNRGLGVDDPAGANPIGTKRVYLIDITGATDIAAISLDNTNALPAGVAPVSKSATPYIDIQAAIAALGHIVPEKLEGLTIGPKLADGTYLILVGTDNDFSVTQTGTGTQLDVLISGNSITGPITGSQQITLDGAVPDGFAGIPGFLFAFKSELGDVVSANFQPAQVPEPATGLLVTVAGAAVIATRRRRA